MKRSVLLASAVAVAVVLVLAGCSSTPSSPASSPHATSTAAAVPGLPAGVAAATNIPTTVVNSAMARQSVGMGSCTKTAGGWEATGSAQNPGKSSATYRITVFFTTKHATVINFATTMVTVAPGGKGTWSAKAKFVAPATTTCVLRGVGE